MEKYSSKLGHSDSVIWVQFPSITPYYRTNNTPEQSGAWFHGGTVIRLIHQWWREWCRLRQGPYEAEKRADHPDYYEMACRW